MVCGCVRNDRHVNHSLCYRTFTLCALCIPNLKANDLHHRFCFCQFIVRFQSFDIDEHDAMTTMDIERKKKKMYIRGSIAFSQYNLITMRTKLLKWNERFLWLWFRLFFFFLFLFSPPHSHFNDAFNTQNPITILGIVSMLPFFK